MKHVAAFAVLVLTSVVNAAPALAETRLLMLEEQGCMWCKKWHDEIGGIYPKTTEGQRAPLLRADLRGPLPEGAKLASRATFTPTFVLLENGLEVGRLEGYPGEAFFWGLLSEMIRALPDEQNGVAAPASVGGGASG